MTLEEIEEMRAYVERRTAEQKVEMERINCLLAASRARTNAYADHATHIRNVAEHVEWLEAKLTPPKPKRPRKKRV